MTVAPTLERYLASKNINLRTHLPCHQTARPKRAGSRAIVSPKRLCFATRTGLLAILPASHHIRLSDLKRLLGFDVALATEQEIRQLFEDCAQGAVPSAGECYRIDVIVGRQHPRHSRRSTWMR